MLIVESIFDLLENLFKCITSIFGNLKIVMSFSILSTDLHLEHLYPHFSIYSGWIKFYKHFSTLELLLGIDIDKSIKLSKLKL